MDRYALFRSHLLFHDPGNAVTLELSGVTDIQPANALLRLAGDFAFLPFTLGILGVGLIGGLGRLCAVRSHGLERRVRAKTDGRAGFYGVITISVLAALVIQFPPISPIKAMFWSVAVNGVVAVPLLATVTRPVSWKSIRGACYASRSLVILGWITTAVMGIAAGRIFGPSLGGSEYWYRPDRSSWNGVHSCSRSPRGPRRAQRLGDRQ